MVRKTTRILFSLPSTAQRSTQLLVVLGYACSTTVLHPWPWATTVCFKRQAHLLREQYQARAPYGFLGARNPPFFSLKMQDLLHFLKTFARRPPEPPPPPLEGHRRTRLSTCMLSLIRVNAFEELLVQCLQSFMFCDICRMVNLSSLSPWASTCL